MWLAAACGRQAPPPPAQPGPDVWAVVDGREIKKDDVERAYRRAAPLDQPPSEEEVLAAKLRILNELIDQDIMLQKARTLKLEVPAAEIDKAFAERKSNMPDEAFQKELAQRGLTADDMKRALGHELTVRKVLEQEVGGKIAVTDQAIREFYEKNRQQFNVAEARYRIAQILVTPVRDAQTRNRTNDNAATPEEAIRKAQMLLEKLKGGADFAAVAMDYSEDPQSAPQGGDLGFVPASALNNVAPELRARRPEHEARPGQRGQRRRRAHHLHAGRAGARRPARSQHPRREGRHQRHAAGSEGAAADGGLRVGGAQRHQGGQSPRAADRRRRRQGAGQPGAVGARQVVEA